MDIVGSKEFRQKCVEELRKYNYQDKDDFFQRYLNGEDFSSGSLLKMGYDHFSARNINAYINNPHDHYYSYALGWE